MIASCRRPPIPGSYFGAALLVGALALTGCQSGDVATATRPAVTPPVATSTPAPTPQRSAVAHCSEPPTELYQLAYEVPGTGEVSVTCDIVYKQIAGADATLDLHLPRARLQMPRCRPSCSSTAMGTSPN